MGKLVFTSSPSVTFDGTDQCGVDETGAVSAAMAVPLSTHESARGASRAGRERSPRDVHLHLRPHLIWGPRDRHLVPRLIERAQRGRLRQVGDGQNLVDMVYVENAAQAHLQAADALEAHSPVAGRAYFISQGEPVRCWEWMNAVLELAGLPPVPKVSAATAWCVGSSLEAIYRLLGIAQEPMMTRFLAAQLSTSHYFAIDRTRRDFGYRPTVSTAEGMRRLGRWLAERSSAAPRS